LLGGNDTSADTKGEVAGVPKKMKGRNTCSSHKCGKCQLSAKSPVRNPVIGPGKHAEEKHGGQNAATNRNVLDHDCEI